MEMNSSIEESKHQAGLDSTLRSAEKEDESDLDYTLINDSAFLDSTINR
jgi:hypothetical protein